MGLDSSTSSGDDFSSSSESSSDSSDEFVGSIFSTESSDDSNISDSSQPSDAYDEDKEEYTYEDEDDEKEQKSSSKGFIIVIVIICLVLLGGGFAYLYLHQQNDESLKGSTSEQPLLADSTEVAHDSLAVASTEEAVFAETLDEENHADASLASVESDPQHSSTTASTPSHTPRPTSSEKRKVLSDPDGRFYIIIASFSFKRSAEAKVAEISRQDYTPKMIMPFQGSPYYRVAIEGFPSHAEAHRHIAKYRSKFGRSAWVLSYQ